MTAMYRKQYKKPWTFTKSGIVILKEKDIIVLEEGIHLKNAMPHIITDSCILYKIWSYLSLLLLTIGLI